MSEFSDKVILITGAGLGLGQRIAQEFARQGASIAANDLTPINLDKTIELIQVEGGQVKDYVFDIAKRLPVQAMVEMVVEEFGRIDVLVNCAEVKPISSILDMDDWDWQRTLEVNLSGPFFTMQHAGRAMRQAGGGSIINLGLASARLEGLVNQAAFAASKAGLVGLSCQAARELAPYKIRVNVVCPSREMPEEAIAKILYLASDEAKDVTGEVFE